MTLPLPYNLRQQDASVKIRRLRFYAMLVFDQNNIDKVIDREANILSQAIHGYRGLYPSNILMDPTKSFHSRHSLTNYIEFDLADLFNNAVSTTPHPRNCI